MVHIGRRIEEQWLKSGMTKLAFAERIGIHRNGVKSLFDSPGADTMLLMKISNVLKYDFFSVYSASLMGKASNASMAQEPAANYKKESKPMRVVFEFDTSDPEAREMAQNLMAGVRKKV